MGNVNSHSRSSHRSGKHRSAVKESGNRRSTKARGSGKKTTTTKGSKRHSSSALRDSTKTDVTARSSVSSDSASFTNEESIVLTKESPIPANCPKDLKVIRDFIRYKDKHNLEMMKKLTADDCFFNFTDEETGTEMPAREFYEAMKDIYASFPDLDFFWKSMKLQGVNGPESRHPGTVVVIEDYYGIGHHTGTPYKFGPYEPVKPAGLEVRDEDIEFTFIVNNGKISHATIHAFGKVVGPPGFYTKIGGLIM